MAHTNGDKVKHKEDCGCSVCEINALGFPLYISYCPKHAAAPAMYEALKGIFQELQQATRITDDTFGKDWKEHEDKIIDILYQAEGKS